ncbi:MAG: sigma-54-dependent Fis family transcriptional regulator [Candidatus Schekmanbacteria bacterium]|nr:sigma-54-dependent Fis family transcriptional regulator [Candidatus Schekmanbacteria bacterium]
MPDGVSCLAPVAETAAVVSQIRDHIDQRRQRDERAAATPAPTEAVLPFRGIIGQSPPIREMLTLVEKVARSQSTIMIYGESGTGKELVARAIHVASDRNPASLVCVNCGALSDSLLESELFGHEKGAYTDAHRTRAGRFELADGGTLFLDEVGNMSEALQVRLLRVLQERQFERVGGTKTIQVDVRFIGATSADLERRVAEGTFRKDLFYRLNVIPISLPPLRDRTEDIPLLAQHFVRRSCSQNGWRVKATSQGLLRQMMRYEWPGNVRQLENVIERMVTLAGERDHLLATDLPPDIQPSAQASPPPTVPLPDEGVDFKTFVSEIERELLLRSLQRTGGNKSQAADLLGMKRTTFIEKLKRFNLFGD